jgi:uncharacterized protein YggU (UPF0235/DUF167 family)
MRTGRAMLIEVRVKPRARASTFEPAGDGTFVAQLKASPVAGKANEELIALVARHFGCSRRAVSIKSGASARTKRLQIDSA